jgi:hypothetical protein
MQHHQCMGYAMQHKTDTTAAVQVRLRGSILIEFENWRRAQREIPSKAEAFRQLLERALASDGPFPQLARSQRSTALADTTDYPLAMP